MNLEVVRSTVSGNKALGEGDLSVGGGISYTPAAGGTSSSSFTLENSTVANNLAKAEGGDGWGAGLLLQPIESAGGTIQQTLTNSTIAGNVAVGAAGLGGGIYMEPVISPRLPKWPSSLVADNTAATGRELPRLSAVASYLGARRCG